VKQFNFNYQQSLQVKDVTESIKPNQLKIDKLSFKLFQIFFSLKTISGKIHKKLTIII
jgi:hypothetical protein